MMSEIFTQRETVLSRLIQLNRFRPNQFITLYNIKLNENGNPIRESFSVNSDAKRIGVKFNFDDVPIVGWLVENQYVESYYSNNALAMRVTPLGESKCGKLKEEYMQKYDGIEKDKLDLLNSIWNSRGKSYPLHNDIPENEEGLLKEMEMEKLIELENRSYVLTSEGYYILKNKPLTDSSTNMVINNNINGGIVSVDNSSNKQINKKGGLLGKMVSWVMGKFGF